MFIRQLFPKVFVCVSLCVDAGGAAAAAYCLRLKIEGLSQTQWCHHWAGEPHNNLPPMWSLFSDNLIDQNQSADRIHCEVLHSCAALYAFVCLPVGVDFSMRPCLHLVIPAPPSSRWQLACLCFSHKTPAEALLHWVTSHPGCQCCIQHTLQRAKRAVQINQGQST